jgi:hypothetical protein
LIELQPIDGRKYRPKILPTAERKALAKELGKARDSQHLSLCSPRRCRPSVSQWSSRPTNFSQTSCESWNERMWSDGDPIDPSPTIGQAVSGGFRLAEIRCKTPGDVNLAC